MSINESVLTSKKCRVLLVDDEPKVLRALSAALDSEYDVELSSSVLDAKLQIINQQYFDVIISDQIMPEDKGHELLNWCVENSPNTKRMMLTGLPITEQLQQKLIAADDVTLLTKPWNIDEIKQSLQKTIGVSQQSDDRTNISQVLIVEPSDKYQKLYSGLPDTFTKPIILKSVDELHSHQHKHLDAQLIILDWNHQLVDRLDMIEALYSDYLNAEFLITADPKVTKQIIHLEKLFSRISIMVKPFSLDRLLHRLKKKNFITTDLVH